MAKQQQHLTTARLSAFIDRQLSTEEQTQSETHLRDCAVCQQQLVELRQTVALLHALPRPPLPRSFTLPMAEAARVSQVTRKARPLAPITPLPRRHGWPVYITDVIRVASTLAAVIGIVFLLSGLFGTVINVGGSATSTSSASTASGVAPSTTTPQSIPHITGTSYQGKIPTPTTGQAVTQPNPNESSVQPNPFQALLDVNMVGTRAILGIILLVLGIIGFIVVGRL
ncbi:MAG: hypothetical protein NVSMB54_30400 [Ktedonobacteraceae bacterium]